MTTTPHLLEYRVPTPAGRRRAGLIVRILLAALIPAALFEAWWVTPDRDYWKEMDFAVFYTAGSAFVAGHDPYDRSAAEGRWQAAGGDDDVMDVIWGPFAGDETDPADRAGHWLPVELIPPGLTVMAPFALADVGLAWPAWNYLVAVLFVGQLYATVKLMRRPLWDWASLAAILFTILLEPVHVGLANGQPSVPAISLLILALYWVSRDRHAAAGVAFAVAVALKPQVAAPFVLVLVFQGRWRTIGVAAFVGAALTWVAVVPLQLRHPYWAHSWLDQLNQAEGTGNIDSARPDNVGRNDLLNLALIGHLFTPSAKAVNTTTVALFFAAVGGLFWYARDRRQSLGVVGAFAVLALLPMYHRYYDAGLLVLPVGWALATLAKPRTEPGDAPVATPPGWTAVNLADRRARWAATAVLACSAVFLFPSEWLVARFREASDETQQRWWFNWILEPHHAWELLAMLAAITAGLVVTRRRPGPTAAPVPPASPWWGRHGVRLAVAALIPLACLYGWWVTPGREDYKECDFAMYYTASRTLLQGRNPYDRSQAFDTFTAEGSDGANGDWAIMDAVLSPIVWDDDGIHHDAHWLPINCIPPALVALAPFARMVEPRAFVAWNVVVSLLLAAQVWALTRLMRVGLWSAATLWVAVVIAATDPTHIGYANGQPSLPSVSLTVVACWLAVANWQLTAGVALAVATALKPQLAGPFVLLFAWQRKWKAVGSTVVVGLALTLAAVVPLVLHDHGPHHLGWLHDWVGEVKFAERPGETNDPRRTNTGRHDMVHLQVLLHFFSDRPALVNAAAGAVVVGLGAALWWAARGRPATDLLAISAFVPLPLLFAYHRLYDCGILILPVGWAMLNCRGGPGRWPARLVLLAYAVYAVPEGQFQTHVFGEGGQPPIGSGWWFELFVEPHRTWGLLVVFASLVVALWRTRPATASWARGFESQLTGRLSASPTLA